MDRHPVEEVETDKDLYSVVDDQDGLDIVGLAIPHEPGPDDSDQEDVGGGQGHCGPDRAEEQPAVGPFIPQLPLEGVEEVVAAFQAAAVVSTRSRRHFDIKHWKIKENATDIFFSSPVFRYITGS